MNDTSKVTNILLAIIAVCLVAIALKPVGVVPDAAAQMRDDRMDMRDMTSRERYARITASGEGVKEQAEATRAVATAIEQLAASTTEVAEAIRDVGQTIAESRGGATSPPPAGGTGTIRIQ